MRAYTEVLWLAKCKQQGLSKYILLLIPRALTCFLITILV